MSPPKDLSDDFVAGQLKKAAKEDSLRYSALGVDAYLPQRRASPALKPNTRFLKAIIKETNSHNASLREETRKNLPSQQGGDRSRERSLDENGDSYRSAERSKHSRRRSLDHSREVGSRRNRKRDSDGDASSLREGRDRRRHRHETSSKHARHGRSRSPRRRQADGHRHRRDAHSSDSGGSSAQASRKHQRRESPSRQSQRKRREATRSLRPIGAEEGAAESRELIGAGGKSRNKSSNLRAFESTETNPTKAADEDSDPLERFIGKASSSKTPIPRGRGARKTRSNMDEHFRSGYNPAADVRPDSDDDNDWDQALEALQDRQRWKELGATRLKEAGFSDRDIRKWERSDKECEEDITWNRSGEGREWDRGKVITKEGHIGTAPPWAA